jgi:gliding motility-associated-like protein
MSGLTNAILPSGSILTNAAGVVKYRALVTSGVCPSIFSDEATVQVDAATVAGTIASSSNLICNGSTPPTISLTGNTGSTLQWRTRRGSAVYVNPIPSQSGTSISSVVNNSASGTVQVVDYYQAIVKSGACNSLTTNEVMVAIDPTSKVGLIEPLQKNQEICIGSSATSIVLPSHTGTIQWQTANLGGSYTDMTGLTNTTLLFGNILTNVAGTKIYRAQVTSGVCPAIYSEIASVRVDATTVAGDIYFLNGNSSICNLGDKPTISIKNNTGTSIVWQITTVSNSNSVIGTANSLDYTNTNNTGNLLNSGIDNTASGAISSFKYYRASVRNGACKTEFTQPIELEVIPTPVVTKVVPAERCGFGNLEILAESNLGIPNWFEANSGGAAIVSANTFTTPLLSNSTNYYAGAIFRGCTSFDRTAVLAKIKPIPSVTSVINANNCGPGNLELSASVSGGIVNWFTDANAGSTLLTAPKYTTPSISNTTTYYAEALLDGCISSPRTPVVATIFEVPTFKPLPDLFNLCAGSRLSLNNYVAQGAPPYNYIFNTNNGNLMGQKDGYLLGVKGGMTDVYFNVKDMNGCISQNTNSFQVKTNDPVKPKIFFQEAFYDFNTIIKTKVDSGYSVYDWSPTMNLDFYNDKDPVFRGINNVTYDLYRLDTTSNCSVTDTYNITITTDFIFDLPNAFTPNFDGLNDVIKSMYNSGIASLNFLKIYNRNGNIVFQTSSLSAGWDGRVNGVDQDADAYFWTAEYVTRKSETFRKSGSFLLIK